MTIVNGAAPVRFPAFDSEDFFVSGFAETNRLPFDFAEAEAELVAGYHTEYSSMKFALFFMAEYMSMTTMAALTTTLYLGGWDIPWYNEPPTFLGFLLCVIAAGSTPATGCPSNRVQSVCTPGIRSLLNPKAKFIRLTRSPVFTHVSAIQLYPLGVCIPYSGIPNFSSDCNRGIAFFTSAPLARTAETTNSSGLFIFARYTSGLESMQNGIAIGDMQHFSLIRGASPLGLPYTLSRSPHPPHL